MACKSKIFLNSTVAGLTNLSAIRLEGMQGVERKKPSWICWAFKGFMAISKIC